MTMPDWYKPIHEHGACYPPGKYVGRYESYADMWAKCLRGDWLLWIIGKAALHTFTNDDRSILVVCASECARVITGKEVLEGLDRRRFPSAYGAVSLRETNVENMATVASLAASLSGSAPHEQRVVCWEKCANIVRQHYPEPPTLLMDGVT